MARLLTNNFALPYSSLLSNLSWSPLWRRVLTMQLCLFYKLYHGIHFAPTDCFPSSSNRRSARLSHSKTVSLHARTVTTNSQFFYRISSLWNVLPDAIVTAPYSVFKSYVESEQLIALLSARGLITSVDCN